MLRRRRVTEPNYDFVLDTMTNVVGILIIVVALTRIGVTDAVTRVREAEAVDGIPLGPELVEKAEVDLDDLRALVASLREQWAERETQAPPLRAELAALGQTLEALHAANLDPGKVRVRKQDLVKELERLRQEVPAFEAELASFSKKLSHVASRLQSTPADPARELDVTLPSPDENRSRGKTIVEYLCKGYRVYRHDVDNLYRASWARLKAAGQRQRFDEGADVLGWCVTQLRRMDIKDSTFRIRGRLTDLGALQLIPVLRPEARGDTAKDIASGRSRLARVLSRLDPKRHWIYFLTYDDSFEAYLQARKLAEEAGYAVGWLPYGMNQYVGWFPGQEASGVTPKPD